MRKPFLFGCKRHNPRVLKFQISQFFRLFYTISSQATHPVLFMNIKQYLNVRPGSFTTRRTIEAISKGVRTYTALPSRKNRTLAYSRVLRRFPPIALKNSCPYSFVYVCMPHRSPLKAFSVYVQY